jgi:hypothetical protein
MEGRNWRTTQRSSVCVFAGSNCCTLTVAVAHCMRCALLPVSLCVLQLPIAAQLRPYSPACRPLIFRCLSPLRSPTSPAVHSPPAVRSPQSAVMASQTRPEHIAPPDIVRGNSTAMQCAQRGDVTRSSAKAEVGAASGLSLTQATGLTLRLCTSGPCLFAFARCCPSSSTAMTKRRNMRPSQCPCGSASPPTEASVSQLHADRCLMVRCYSRCVLLPVPA